MAKSETGVYLVLGEANILLTNIRRSNRWASHNTDSENQNELISNLVYLKNLLNEITDLKSISSTDFLHPFLAIVRSEQTTGPITGLALNSINKFISHHLIEFDTEQGIAASVGQIADAVTHARFVGTDAASDEVVLLKILYVLHSLMLCSCGVYLTNESVCEIIRSCFRICFELRLTELLRKSAEQTLVDIVQFLFSRLFEFKDDSRLSPLKKLRMRTGSGSMSSNKGSRLRKKSPKLKWKNKTSKEPINLQDSSSFNQTNPTRSSKQSSDLSTNITDNNNNQNTQEKSNKINSGVSEHVDECTTNEINHSSPGSSQDISGAQETEIPTSENNGKKDADDLNNGSSSNFNTTNNSADSFDNNTSHRAVKVPDSLNISSGFQSLDRKDTHQTEEETGTQDHSADDEGRGVHGGFTPASEGPELSEDPNKENFIWAGSAETTTPTTTPSDPPIDHLLCEEGEDRKEDEKTKDFVNRRGVHFTHQDDDDFSQTLDENTALGPYSIPCIRELFRFLISITNPFDKENSENMIQMGLSLLTVSLESGADHISQCKSLLQMVKEDMCKHLFFLLKVERLSLYAAAIRVCFLMFESMRGHLKLQLEMYVMKLMELVVSDVHRDEQKEIALESILQMLRIPGLISELYLNYDCSFYCSNLFEDLTKLLSKNAFPVSGLVSTNLLSLNALLAIVDTIVSNCQHRALNHEKKQEHEENPRAEFGSMDNLPHMKNASTPMKQPSMGNKSSNASSALLSDRVRKNRMKVLQEIPTSEELALIKHKKKVYQTGTEQFNQKPSEGILFLQKHGLLSAQLDPEEVVSFIKQNPKLDKKQIGEFISARKNNNILEAYQKSFNFEGTRIDEALRMYLETFRLPGEAPVISYLLEHFAEHWHKTNKEPFENADAAFTLAYAVIMLNVDQHNFNAKKQNIPMTCENFKKNLSKVNGDKDFDAEMLEEVYQCIKNEEIVMPAEQVGLVRDNYLWKVLLRRSQNKESDYQFLETGTYDRDLFSIVWGPTVAALSFVFDRSTDNTIVQKAVNGFRKCAMISAYYEMSDVFDNLVISLCKFTTLLSQPESPESLAINFGNNPKAQLAARTVFALAHRHSDILHDGWRNILDCIMQLFRANLLSEVLVKVEDFFDPSGRISLVKEEQASHNKVDTGMLSNLYTFFSMSEAPQKAPPQEDLQATKRAQDCILECHVEQLIMESKFLRDDSLQELLKALIYDSRCTENLDETHDESQVLRLELLFKVVLQNRDRISNYWSGIEDHLFNTIAGACECTFMVERAVVGLLRLACRLLRREELSSKVLTSLRILLLMKSGVMYNHVINRHMSYGVHDLLKTNASNIHTLKDWKVIFTIICVAGVALITSPSLSSHFYTDQLPSLESEAQSDSELNKVKKAEKDRGYTSDSEVYDGLKPAAISSSSSFQNLPGSNEEVIEQSETVSTVSSIPPALKVPPSTPHENIKQETKSKKRTVSKNFFDPDSSWFSMYQTNKDGQRSKHSNSLDHTYNISLTDTLAKHDFKSFSKCCETLSFLVRDAAQITPLNLPTCIHSIRLFVEASVDGGGNHRVQQPRNKGHHSKNKKETMMRKSRSSPSHLLNSKALDDEDDEYSDAYQTISIQLLDLMHTLHTRAASIFKDWDKNEDDNEKLVSENDASITDNCSEESSQLSLWSSCWCPLLQGIARLCCDSRKQVRNQALTYLQRALLVHDLQVLKASEWEDCFSRVLFPLLSMLLQSISPWDKGGAEETRMRASALLCKVFLQHLTPLLSLPTFTALWLTILDFMHKYMHADQSDLLLEAIPESLKNMLLVMQTAGILKETSKELWDLTWDRINLFLPHLQKELFKSSEQEITRSSSPPNDTETTPEKQTVSIDQPSPSTSSPPPSSVSLHSPPPAESDGTSGKDFMSSIPLPTSHLILHPPLPSFSPMQHQIPVIVQHSPHSIDPPSPQVEQVAEDL